MKYLNTFKENKEEKITDPKFLEIIEWINNNYDEGTLESDAVERSWGYIDSYEIAGFLGVDQDEYDENPDDFDEWSPLEVYQNYCMGGAISYDMMSDIREDTKKQFPDDYDEWSDILDEYINGLVGEQGYDTFNCSSTDEYELYNGKWDDTQDSNSNPFDIGKIKL